MSALLLLVNLDRLDSGAMPNDSNLPRAIPELDGLRGMAALVVVISHSANAGFLPAVLGHGLGQAGVALFFALSGFLMAHACFGETPDRAGLIRFAVNRASRVLPVYFFVVLVSTLAYVLAGRGFYAMDTPVVILRDWLLVRGSGVLWSVPVEIHFYLLFAGLWLARAHGHLAVAGGTALVLGLSLIALGQGGQDAPASLGHWLHFFLIGLAIHQLCERRNPRRDNCRGPGKALAWLACAGLALLPPQMRVALGWPDFPNNLDPMTLLFVPLVLWCCVAGAGPLGWLACPLPRWLGRVSFSLYLVHEPVIEWVQGMGRVPAFAQFVGVLATSGAAAWTMYSLVELPAQAALRKRFRASVSDQASARLSPPTPA